MLEQIIKNELEDLKIKESWTDRKRLKKEINELKSIVDKVDCYSKLFNHKRITIVSREVLKRGKGGYFSNKKEVIRCYDLTDLQIARNLEKLNKNKRTRFFKVEYDFNLKTKKGLKEYKHYLVDNEII